MQISGNKNVMMEIMDQEDFPLPSNAESARAPVLLCGYGVRGKVEKMEETAQRTRTKTEWKSCQHPGCGEDSSTLSALENHQISQPRPIKF